MKRVLLVTYYFPPMGGGGVPRALKLAKYLPAFGWAPHVLTVRDGLWSAFDDTPLAELSPEVIIHRTPFVMAGQLIRRMAGGAKGRPVCTEDRVEPEHSSLRERAKDAFRKVAYVPDEFIGWYPFAVRAGKRVVHEMGIDVVVSTSPPPTAHLVGRAIARSTGLPWVADFRDLWTHNPGFLHGAGLRGRVERRLERAVIRAATRIVTVTEPFRDDVLAEHRGHVDPRHVRVIMNGFDPDDFQGGSLPVHLSPDPKRFRVVYTGGWMDNRSPQTFFKALSRYADSKASEGMPINAIFAGTEQSLVRAEAERAGVPALVHTVGYLPPREACALQQSADALLLTLSNRANSSGVIPGKIFQYFGAGRPLLALVPRGVTADLVRKAGAGLVIDPEDADGATRALVAMAKTKSAGTPVRGADSETLAPYTRRAIAKRYAAVLDEVSRL